MRHSVTLTWWLFLASAWAAAAYFLDLHHHMVWGKVGLLLLKSSYLGFAVVLLLRFLSFNAQRNFESMADAYSRLANAAQAEPKRKLSLFNPLFLSVLIVLTTMDFLLSLRWSESAFRSTLLLDAVIWIMVIYWVGRVHWLKSMGRRERLKEQLDDARSRHKQTSSPEEATPKPRDTGKRRRVVILVQAGMALALALYLGGDRWRRSTQVFRVEDLKACMDECLALGLEGYFQHGKLGRDSGAPCVEERRNLIRVTLDVRNGEVFVKAMESESGDYFGNGRSGDEGLLLDAGRRYRKLGGEAW